MNFVTKEEEEEEKERIFFLSLFSLLFLMFLPKQCLFRNFERSYCGWLSRGSTTSFGWTHFWKSLNNNHGVLRTFCLCLLSFLPFFIALLFFCFTFVLSLFFNCFYYFLRLLLLYLKACDIKGNNNSHNYKITHVWLYMCLYISLKKMCIYIVLKRIILQFSRHWINK